MTAKWLRRKRNVALPGPAVRAAMMSAPENYNCNASAGR